MSLDEAIASSIDASPIAMVVTDPRKPDNPIEYANHAFCALTGYSKDEIIGRNCRFLAGEATEAVVQAEIRSAVADQRPVLVEMTNYRRDGSAFRNGVMIAPLFDADGKLEYFLGSQVDLGAADDASMAARRARAITLVAELPERQRQVLEAMAKGTLNKQIAFDLGIAEKTVKMHRMLLLERLGGVTTAEAIRIAVEAGL